MQSNGKVESRKAAGAFQTRNGTTQTSPLGPERSASTALTRQHQPKFDHVSPWLRWAVDPLSALKLLVVPFVLYGIYELFAPYLDSSSHQNPFASFFQISGYVDTSKPDDPRYAKSYHDLIFLAYHIVFFSCVRQFITINLSRPIAKYFGLKRESKIDRFGEQMYALVYFMVLGVYGYSVMTRLPTYWYRTQYFWIDYPHWDMNQDMKRYYLMQFSYWCQQLLVLLLGLEKPRKDYSKLVAHHIITLWLVGGSYVLNCTYMGNAVFISMDIPDTLFAFSKLLNYIQWERAKMVSFVTFIAVWTYFRHYLNIVMLWSVLFESHLVPDFAKQWSSSQGVYMVFWLPPVIFASMFFLQCLNLYWYYLMLRILIRAILTSKTEDERSEDEDDGEEVEVKKED